MSVLGIDQITYGTDDLAVSRRFFADWGLALVSEAGDELVEHCLKVLKAHRISCCVEGDPPIPG